MNSRLLKRVGVVREVDLQTSQGPTLHQVVWPQTTEGMEGPRATWMYDSGPETPPVCLQRDHSKKQRQPSEGYCPQGAVRCSGWPASAKQRL